MQFAREFPASASALDDPQADESAPAASATPFPAAPVTAWPVADWLLVLLVIVMVTAVIITALLRRQHDVRVVRFADQLVAASTAFQNFHRQHTTVPDGADAGVIPAGMGPWLSAPEWTAPTPVGGMLRWTRTGGANVEIGRPMGVISVLSFQGVPEVELSPADLLAIDRRIDDGDLAGGNFRRGFNGWPVLAVPHSK